MKLIKLLSIILLVVLIIACGNESTTTPVSIQPTPGIKATAETKIAEKVVAVQPTVVVRATPTPSTPTPEPVDLSGVSIFCELNEQSKVVSCRISHDIDAKQMKWSSNASNQWYNGRDFALTIHNQMEVVEIQLELCVANDCRTLKKVIELPPGFSGKSGAVRSDTKTPKQSNMQGEKKGGQNEETLPPALIKSLGYDFSTGVIPILIIDYGTLTHTDVKRPVYNLQPTFVLPAGTKVTAIIDGVVCRIPKLYSGDYSVMMAPSCDNVKYMWEMEHVINVIVEVGDRVKAGQHIAEVSNYSYEFGDPQGLNPSRPDRKYGFDLVEIGLLQGGGAPLHHCPWLYIDPSYKEELLEMMAEARKSIETETAGTPNSEFIRWFLKGHITDWETPDGRPHYNSTDYQAPSCKFTNIIGEDGMPIPD